MTAKRLLFWGAVGGVSLMASFGVALIANKTGVPGLQKFRAFTYGVPAS